MVRRAITYGAVAAAWANLSGAVVVYVLLAFVLPIPEVVVGTTLVRNLVYVSLFVGILVPVGLYRGSRRAWRTMSWLREDRIPTPQERRATLRLPLRISLLQTSMWGLAAVLFTVVNGQVSIIFGFEVAGVALGGEVREVAVLSVDVVGSTTLAEQIEATQVVDRLNAFLGAAGAAEQGCWREVGAEVLRGRTTPTEVWVPIV